jgi:hypothetical protein
MATNTTGTSARRYHHNLVHELSANFTFADDGKVLALGTLPAGAVILKGQSGVLVHVVFNAGTTNVLDIGTSANDDLYGTDLALGTAAFVPLDEVVDYRITTDTAMTATVDLTGTAATTGAATIIISYIIPS